MPIFVTDCPHCQAVNMSFTYQGEYVIPDGTAFAFARCSGCYRPICIEIVRLDGYGIASYPLHKQEGDLLSARNYRAVNIWPTVEEIDIPLSVPERVGRNFHEAAVARSSQLWNAACGSYRRCMEIALKQFAPDVEAWKLEKRIDKLAAENRITPDIQKWAHELRLDGNQAVHADEDATEEMVDQMHHLTYFLLTYLYTLPNQIEEVRARRAATEQE